MTNTAKKPAKKSDTLDLDLDARLDSATATLYLEDEPVEGDMLDQVLAKAKKELDAVLPEPDDIKLDDALGLPEIDDVVLDEIEKTIPLQSESLTSLENQLAAAMETPVISDDELDDLLGGEGFDFDSLLGDADDELTINDEEINEESLLAAVDELLNFGMDVEPEVVDIEPEVEAVVEPEIVEIEPEVEAIVEPEIVDIEPEVEAVVEPEIVDIEPEVEAVVEPEIVDIEPEVEAVVESEIVEIEPEVEAVVEPEIVDIEPEDADLELNFEFESEGFLEPEVSEVTQDNVDNKSEIELTVEPNAALDDLVDSVPFEDTLKVGTDDIDEFFVEEFNDFDNVADIAAPLVEISLPSDEELDVAQQLDGLNDAMENTIDDTTAGFDLLDDADEKAKATPVAENAEDDLDWMKQLDELDAAEKAEPVAEEKTETEAVADEDDWMKQLDDLDAAEPVAEEKAETEAVADDDDWMKQLDELDAAEPVAEEKTETETVADDDDWMKQLDDLDAAEPVAEEKAETEAVADDDDWMKQLEDLDAADSPEDGADDWMKQLDSMDDQSANANDTAIDDDFNIADEKVSQIVAPAINEEALIAKAAEMAIGQFKDEQELAISALKEKQDLAFSQLRADQDTLEGKNRKQFADAESGRKKAATFGFAALGVGIVGLIGSGAIGYLSMGTKTETETLAQSVAELQETVNDIVNKAPEKEKEIAGIKTSVEQLNQKVEKLVAAQATATVVAPTEAAKVSDVKTTEPAKSSVNLSNGKTPVVTGKVAPLTTGKIDTGFDSAKLAETDIVPPVDISPAHPTGEKAEQPKLSDMAKKSADETKVKDEKVEAEKVAKAAKAAKAEAEKVKAKEEAALLTEKLTKISTIAKAAAASTKTEEPRASRYTGKMTRGMARGVAKEHEGNRVTAKTDAKKEVLNTAIKPQKAVPAGKYTVNVVS
ncbi:MAG: hypothetical protein PHC99_09345, partial [Methylococcales bacterium]|nr:hypothetical protein [Methylococcales bacterium]